MVNWQNLAKNATDPQIIDEAIDQAITDHNNDPNAHMLADEALDIHRTSSVVDHPAESVVNDKLQVYARSYVAIVDPDDEEAFDTIEGAYAYADTVGGGTILITPGTHYLSSVINVNHNINLEGTDRDDCIIVTDEASGENFDIDTTSIPAGSQATWRRLTFAPISNYIITNTTNSYNNGSRFVFEDCNFIGRVGYLSAVAREMIFNGCYIDLGTTAFAEFYNIANFYGCELNNSVGSSTGILNGGSVDDLYMIIDGCYTPATVTGKISIIGNASVFSLTIVNSDIHNLATQSIPFTNAIISNNHFELGSSDYIELDNPNNIFTNNRLLGGSGNRFRMTSQADECIVADNQIGTEITIAGSNNIIRNNKTTATNDYHITATTDTALNFANNESVYQEPSATKTLTTTVPPAGTVRVLILKQTNTTDKTMTFGTGFKTTGTLALGTTANRWFTLIFVSDGTYLIQIARSTAIA